MSPGIRGEIRKRNIRRADWPEIVHFSPRFVIPFAQLTFMVKLWLPSRQSRGISQWIRGRMRKIAMLFTALALTAVALAQDPVAAKIDELQKELNAAVALRATLDDLHSKAHAEANDIDLGAAALHKATQAYVDHSNALDAATKAYNALPVCHYPVGHPEQCQGVIDQKAALVRQRAALDQEFAAKNQLADVLLGRIAKWQPANAELTRRHDLNKADIKRLTAELDALRKGNDACKQAILNGSPETMHDVCGQMFDGNH